MKGGVGIPNQDKDQIWDKIKAELIHIATEREQQDNGHAGEQPLQNEEEQGPRQRHRVQHQDGIDNMLDELNQHYLQEENRRIQNNNDDTQEEPLAAERIANTVTAEITLYREEPSVPLQDAEGKFAYPLKWWQANHRKYRTMSQLALCLLCIPATSAPAERVFSVASLTIAKDHANLAPQTANELIFLHEALPALEKYEESCH
jgi:hypothetical protein